MTRKARLLWTSLLMAVALVAALWVLPARWVMAWIPESSPVVITDASGSLWSAQATVALGVGGLRRSLPDPLKWQLSFAGGPKLVLSHPWLRGPLTLSPGWRGLRLSAQTLQLPASALTSVHAIFNTLDPGGSVFLSWPDLVLGRGVSSRNDSDALLTGQWRNASSSLTRVQPMGAYTLQVRPGTDNALALDLKTDKGPLMMTGEGRITARAGQFDGRAWVEDTASGDTHAALQGVLTAMGPKAGNSGQTLLKIR